MSNRFQIAETDLFAQKMRDEPFLGSASKVRNYVYPQLRENPYYGQNIKKLKGNFRNVYRYRIGKMRLFYTIDKINIIVIMADVEQRKDSYS